MDARRSIWLLLDDHYAKVGWLREHKNGIYLSRITSDSPARSPRHFPYHTDGSRHFRWGDGQKIFPSSRLHLNRITGVENVGGFDITIEGCDWTDTGRAGEYELVLRPAGEVRRDLPLLLSLFVCGKQAEMAARVQPSGVLFRKIIVPVHWKSFPALSGFLQLQYQITKTGEPGARPNAVSAHRNA